MSMNFPQGLDNRFWVMGLTFLHNYYTVFDPKGQRVGFIESAKNSNKDIDIKKVMIQETMKEAKSYIGELSIVGIVIVIWLCYIVVKKQ